MRSGTAFTAKWRRSLKGVASKRSIESISISRVIIVDEACQRVWRLLTSLTAPQSYPQSSLITTYGLLAQ